MNFTFTTFKTVNVDGIESLTVDYFSLTNVHDFGIVIWKNQTIGKTSFHIGQRNPLHFHPEKYFEFPTLGNRLAAVDCTIGYYTFFRNGTLNKTGEDELIDPPVHVDEEEDVDYLYLNDKRFIKAITYLFEHTNITSSPPSVPTAVHNDDKYLNFVKYVYNPDLFEEDD